jgi:acetolactate synthase-1/2/3 large subunit
MTGGDVVCITLERLGATTVFGLPGTQNVALFESLRRSNLHTVSASHELAAAFMANGYFRASGRMGVVTTIPGPGFTYALTALAEARHDSAALLYLVVKPAGLPGRKFRLQDIDQVTMARPIVKQTFEIDKADQVAATIAEAWHCAQEGEPGPVYVEISDDVVNGSLTSNGEILKSEAPTAEPDVLASAYELLTRCKRPVFFVGQGAADSSDAVRSLVSKFGCPVLSTCSGRGVVSESDSLLVCGDFSGWGVKLVNELIESADLVLALGCKLTHNGSSGFKLRLPEEKLIHVDTSRETLGANYPAHLPIHSDVARFLSTIPAAVGQQARDHITWKADEVAQWKQKFEKLRAGSFSILPKTVGTESNDIRAFFGGLREVLPSDAIVTTDSGLHQQLVRRFYRVTSPRGMIAPTDYQSMGFGLPAAIGAKIALPERQIVAIIGDGGLAMSGMDLLTAVREKLDLTVIVFNDGYYGQIRQQQVADYGHEHAVKLLNPDLRLLAEALGTEFHLVEGNVKNSLRNALDRAGVSVIELRLDAGAAMHRGQIKTVMKEEIKRRLGPKLTGWLKSLLGKSEK